jgi:hypothetical protein
MPAIDQLRDTCGLRKLCGSLVTRPCAPHGSDRPTRAKTAVIVNGRGVMTSGRRCATFIFGEQGLSERSGCDPFRHSRMQLRPCRHGLTPEVAKRSSRLRWTRPI